jgi:DNA-binding beta-propeller fold protein YncE
MRYIAGNHAYETVDDWPHWPERCPFDDVPAVGIDSQDRVYVLSRGEHPVTIFDHDGNFLNSWGDGVFKMTHGIFVGPDGSVYCTDIGNHTVSKFTLEGKLLMTLGKKDQPSDTGFKGLMPPKEKMEFFDKLLLISSQVKDKKQAGPPFYSPTGIFVSSSGEIFVSDGYGNARVHKFSPDGALVLSWGEVGNKTAEFMCPHSIWIDKLQRVWVADRENFRIQIFNLQGEFISQLIDLGMPNSIFIDNETVFITEGLCQRVSIFTLEGKLIARWDNQEEKYTAPFSSIHHLIGDSRGNIYISNAPVSMWGRDIKYKTIVKLAKIY